MTFAWAVLWWLLGVISGVGLSMWVQSAREYHERKTENLDREKVAEMVRRTGEVTRD